jgi:hypothetical protein
MHTCAHVCISPCYTTLAVDPANSTAYPPCSPCTHSGSSLRHGSTYKHPKHLGRAPTYNSPPDPKNRAIKAPYTTRMDRICCIWNLFRDIYSISILRQVSIVFDVITSKKLKLFDSWYYIYALLDLQPPLFNKKISQQTYTHCYSIVYVLSFEVCLLLLFPNVLSLLSSKCAPVLARVNV